MDIRWFFYRLRAMSLPEILHRVREKLRKLIAKGRLEGWARYQTSGASPALPHDVFISPAIDQATQAAIKTAAETIKAGHFSALGVTWPRITFPLADNIWRLDPVTAKLWPGAELYCFDLPYRHERVLGDIKYVWEYNRLQFLQVLAADVFLFQNAQSRGLIEEVITSFYANNPPFRGLAWNSGIEVALRAISLLMVTSLAGDQLAPPVISKIRAILAASLFWLNRFPSRFSSANNHLIAEAAAEVLITTAMPDLPQAKKIGEKARQTLEEEALLQFFQDGVPAEQSPTYGAFSAEFLQLVHRLHLFSPAAWQRLERFADYIAAITDSGGHVPAIGDDDEGRVLLLPFTGAYPQAIMRAMKARPAPPKAGITAFEAGGYSVLRQQDWQVVVDHGGLGYLSIAAHGHADALAVLASWRGVPLLVDAGTYLYHSGGEWRDWFRATPAHNTLNIKGISQSTISGAFNWSHKAQAQRISAEEGEGFCEILAAHDGYRSTFGVMHHRKIRVEGEGVVIYDQLIQTEGRPEKGREVEIVFQCAIGAGVEILGREAFVVIKEHQVEETSSGDRTLKFRFFAENDGEWQVFSGEEPAKGGGWVSPAFGVKCAAPRLVWRGVLPENGGRISLQPCQNEG